MRRLTRCALTFGLACMSSVGTALAAESPQAATSKQTIRYGKEASQFAELSVPAGKGLRPVIVLIHGGCWLSGFGIDYLQPLVAALNREHYATWTIEYRRLGETGAGWPQTFTDAGTALDKLRELAPAQHLDLARIVTVGHSAGGQLALWLAERPRLPKDSEIRGAAPLKVRAAIGLASITDMQRYRVGPAGSCHSAVDALLGGSPKDQPQHYARTSPAELLPPSVPQWLIQGREDPIVSFDEVVQYVASAAPKAHLVAIPGGHFEPVAPQGPAWTALLMALHEALAD